ncbi:DUF6526 family protein [Chitinophagaceae bacterium LWZ2-11]
MKPQNYKNHASYYPAHHFVFYPLLLVAIIASIRCAVMQEEQRCLWIMFTILLAFIGWLSFMLRQHYALGSQDRIIRLEMRLRYFELTGEKLELIEPLLTFGQLAALRFASDEELVALIEITLKDKLSAKDIKKSIKNWTPDYMRV